MLFLRKQIQRSDNAGPCEVLLISNVDPSHQEETFDLQLSVWRGRQLQVEKQAPERNERFQVLC